MLEIWLTDNGYGYGVEIRKVVHVHRNFKLKIRTNDNDRHHLPHLHIEGPELDASIEISTGDVIVGNITKYASKYIKRWLDIERSSIMKIWEEENPKK